MVSKASLPPRRLFKATRETPKAAPPAPDNPKGGRPPKYPDKPWEALGISRMTFYRRLNRQKAKTDGLKGVVKPATPEETEFFFGSDKPKGSVQ